LLYVAGRPIISHILDDVRTLDVSSVVVIVGYKGDLVKEYVSSEYPDLKVDYVVQEERNGIGHAVNLTRDVANSDESVLVILGDTIIRGDLKLISKSDVNVLAVREVDDPRRFGVVEVKNGRVVKLVEKPKHPKSKLAIVGLYYFKNARELFDTLERQIGENIKSHGEFQITDTMQMMIDAGAIFNPYEIDQWFDCGKPETLLETNRALLGDRTEAPDIPGSIIVGPVSIDPTAVITNSIIGPHVSIASGCSVTNAIIRDSVLDRGATVTDCLLEGSILGLDAVVKGGVKKLNIGDSSEVVFN
jgi:glucose-1-phosphate thymidylyltransferase